MLDLIMALVDRHGMIVLVALTIITCLLIFLAYNLLAFAVITGDTQLIDALIGVIH